MLPGLRCKKKSYRVAGALAGIRKKCYRVAGGHMIHKKLCTARLAFAGAYSDLERLQGIFNAEGWDKKPGQSVWIMIKFIIVSLG